MCRDKLQIKRPCGYINKKPSVWFLFWFQVQRPVEFSFLLHDSPSELSWQSLLLSTSSFGYSIRWTSDPRQHTRPDNHRTLCYAIGWPAQSYTFINEAKIPFRQLLFKFSIVLQTGDGRNVATTIKSVRCLSACYMYSQQDAMCGPPSPQDSMLVSDCVGGVAIFRCVKSPPSGGISLQAHTQHCFSGGRGMQRPVKTTTLDCCDISSVTSRAIVAKQ